MATTSFAPSCTPVSYTHLGTPVVSATKTDVHYAAESGGVTEMSSYADRDTIYSPHEYDFSVTTLAKNAYETYVSIYG